MLSNPSFAASAITLTLVAGFIIDLILPLGVSPVILYLPILVINVRSKFPAYVTFHLCLIISVLIFIAYTAGSVISAETYIVQINRILAISAVWIVGVLCYIIKQAHLRLNEELEMNKQKDSAILHQSRLAGIGEMIGYVAHQWRQPLTTLHLIMFDLKDMHDHGELTSKSLDDSFDQSKTIIQTMSETIDDFRDFFRPAHHDKGRKPVSVVATIKYVMKLVSISFQKNNIEINLELKADAVVIGYRNEFSHALMNILKNSKDAITDRQVPEGCIWIRTIQRKDMIIIEITDNGGGIKASNLRQVFEPYFTTKDRYGTGIGLYMSRVTIHDHMGGNITAKNTVTPYGAGASIEIILPISEDSI